MVSDCTVGSDEDDGGGPGDKVKSLSRRPATSASGE